MKRKREVDDDIDGTSEGDGSRGEERDWDIGVVEESTIWLSEICKI